MTIHFSYDKKKVIQALRYHFISRPEIRIMLILVNVFAVVLFIAFWLKYLKPSHYLVFSVLWIVLMLCFWYLFPHAVYRQTTMFKNPYYMNFSEQQFSLHHESGNSKTWEWDALNNYLESPHFFHLYFSPKVFLLLPKEACKDDEEVHALRKLIQSHVMKGSIK